MTIIHCYSIAEFFNHILTENLKSADDVTVNVNLSSPTAKDDIEEKCAKLLTTSFTNSLPEQIGRFIEHERCQNYTVTFEGSELPFVKYNSINPSLFELSASQIAHYLFPNNFAEYKFIIEPNMDINGEISAGYLLPAHENFECKAKHLDGIENVYATAFYLGLEIRSHKCITSENNSHLFIDDFSHSFHKVNAKQNKLTEEYRDHKILPSEKGTLFPTSFLNMECGAWVDMDCDIEKLENAYNKIVNTPQDEINRVIDASSLALQSIECADSKDDSCRSDTHYQYMHHVKEILLGNHEGISALMINVES